MCRDELCLKSALLSRVHHGISEAEFAGVSRLFTGVCAGGGCAPAVPPLQPFLPIQCGLQQFVCWCP